MEQLRHADVLQQSSTNSLILLTLDFYFWRDPGERGLSHQGRGSTVYRSSSATHYGSKLYENDASISKT